MSPSIDPRSRTFARAAEDGVTCGRKPAAAAGLEELKRGTFDYFLHETNPANGLVLAKTAPNWPASIAATGLALACYAVAVERGLMSRSAAVEICPGSIHCVYETKSWNVIFVSLSPNRFCLRLNTGNGIKYRNSSVKHS